MIFPHSVHSRAFLDCFSYCFSREGSLGVPGVKFQSTPTAAAPGLKPIAMFPYHINQHGR